ncbi:NAD(P)-dependent oxidoreductase [Nocardioides sp. LML1-1-1.1]|uniref:NAD(P)-dependent oxidoreductase n=1 Tax=Nocardioides sp. LML1-1-1.1 TaxID=3135248 RepID=UPI00341EF1E1
MSAVTVFGCDPEEAALAQRLGPRLGLHVTLTSAPASAATAALAASRPCISVDHRTTLDRADLEALAAAGVRLVSTRSIGTDHIDLAHAERLGIEVGNVQYAPDGVADYTVMLILMVLRHAGATLRRSAVHDYRAGPRGRELRDLTVGVVGAGRIGSAVAARLRGFGCRVRTADREAGDRLDDLLRVSDVVTLHTPLDPSTRHLLDARRIGLLRPGACVVNTGRGPLLDTAALLAALEDGRLGGAALDVVEGEERVFHTAHDHPPGERWARLQRLPNVVLTPHTAYATDRALHATVEHSLIHCAEFAKETAWTG